MYTQNMRGYVAHFVDGITELVALNRAVDDIEDRADQAENKQDICGYPKACTHEMMS